MIITCIILKTSYWFSATCCTRKLIILDNRATQYLQKIASRRRYPTRRYWYTMQNQNGYLCAIIVLIFSFIIEHDADTVYCNQADLPESIKSSLIQNKTLTINQCVRKKDNWPRRKIANKTIYYIKSLFSYLVSFRKSVGIRYI